MLTPVLRDLLFCRVAVKSTVIDSARTGRQTPLPMAIVCDGFLGLYLQQAPLKPFKIFPPGELAVKPWRTRLQSVLPVGDQIFHVEQRSKIAAELGAIFVREPGELTGVQFALRKPFRDHDFGSRARFRIGNGRSCDGGLRRAPLGVLLQIDAQSAAFRCTGKLNIHHVQPQRCRYPVGSLANFVQLYRHFLQLLRPCFRPIPPEFNPCADKICAKEKSGL